MIKNIEINLNENSLAISKSKSITGEICFAIEEQYFPELKWNDFVVDLLISWLQGIDDLSKTICNSSYEFHFMDGPFLVRARKTGEDILQLDFLHRRVKGEEKVIIVDCSLRALRNSILKSARKVINESESREWSSEDLKKLRSMISPGSNFR